MAGSIRAPVRRSEGPAFLAAVAAHLTLVALMNAGASPRAIEHVTSAATDESLVEVDVIAPAARASVGHEGRTSMPSLPDSLPSPIVVDGPRSPMPRAPARARARTLLPEPSVDANGAVPRTATPSSSPEPTPDVAVSMAPSSVGEATAEGTRGASGHGADSGEAHRAPATTPLVTATGTPADRCGDPVNGLWHGMTRVRGFAWIEVTLRVERDGDALRGVLVWHSWNNSRTTNPDDRTCGHGEPGWDVQLRAAVSGTARGSYTLRSDAVPPRDMLVECGGLLDPSPWLVAGAYRFSISVPAPDEARARLDMGAMRATLILHRLTCAR